MPPPRRRRPVQPATRVRLPRTARPRPGPAAEPDQAGWPEDGNGNAAGLATTGNGHGPAAVAETAVDEKAVDEKAATVTDLDEAGLTTAEPPGPQPPGDTAAGTAEAELTAAEAEAGTPGAKARADEAGAAVDEKAATVADLDEVDPDQAGLDQAEAGTATGEAEAEAGTVAAGATGAEASPEREPMLLPVCLQVVAVILGGLAVWFALKSGGSSSPSTAFGAPAGSNLAVIDKAATAQVNQQIDSAVDTVFSYSYADTAKTAQAAKSLLTGRASAEYATLFKAVQQQAPKEKLVLTTAVTNSGVEMLSGDTARLLIFANQQDTAMSTHSTTDAGAMFSVTALRQGGRWKIEDIDTFSAGG